MTADNWIQLLGILTGLMSLAVAGLTGFLFTLALKVGRLELKDETRAKEIGKIEKRQDKFESVMQGLTDFLMVRRQPKQRQDNTKPDSDEVGDSGENRW